MTSSFSISKIAGLAAILSLWACGGVAPAASSEVAEPPRHVIYFHGRIIEEQGLPAVSPRHGEYRFTDIVERFEEDGFVVHAELRGPDTDAEEAARQALATIDSLLADGVPPDHITVIGASKGAYIATLVSHLADNPDLRFVLLAGCSAGVVEHMLTEGIGFTGHVLAIRDSLDTELSGSCEDVAAASPGIGEFREVIVETGLEHGLIYTPRDEWYNPATSWAMGR